MWPLLSKIFSVFLDMFISNKNRKEELRKRFNESMNKHNASATDAAKLRQEYDSLKEESDGDRGGS